MVSDEHKQLINRIEQKLFEPGPKNQLIPGNTRDVVKQAAVLLPVGAFCGHAGVPEEVCLILNKRSEKVRQSGDLCCPGGGVSPIMDTGFARLLFLPFSPPDPMGFLGKMPVTAWYRRQKTGGVFCHQPAREL